MMEAPLSRIAPTPNRPNPGWHGASSASGLFRTSGIAIAMFCVLAVVCPQGKAGEARPIRELTLVSAPRLSPDGARAVFEWCGDLWIGPSGGGEAVRLVCHPAADTQPWFGADGTRVVFQSDRSGMPQVYSVPVGGGEVRRHSAHGEGCELVGLGFDGTRAVIRGRREISNPRDWRLMEIDLSGEHRERRIFDAGAESPHESADGREWLFVRNGEQLYRQGYRGSRAAQIWRFNRSTGRFCCELAEPTESLCPLWSGDGGFFYVSARDGTHNLWKRHAGGNDEQRTHYRGAGVVMPAISADGTTLMFRQNNQVLRLRSTRGSEPEAVRWFTREPLPTPQVAPEISRKVDDATYHPQRGWFAAIGGRLWWKSAPSAIAKPIFRGAAFDSCVRISRDGRHLAWLRDDGLRCEIVVAPVSADGVGPETTVATMPGSAAKLSWFPDSKSLGWISGLGDVWVCGLDSRPARKAFPCWDRPVWDASPDGRWLVVAALDAAANRDLWLVSTSGATPPVNLTRSPGWESFPLWSPDGNALLFRSRAHRDAPESLCWLPMSPDRILGPTDAWPPRAAADSAKPLPIRNGPAMQVRWSHDGSAIWYQGRKDAKRETRLFDLGKRTSRVALADRGMPVEVLADGGLAQLRGGIPECVWPDGRREMAPFEVKADWPASDLLRWRFRQIWRALGERFYDPGLHGLDWDAVRAELEPVAAGAADSRQFDRVVNQLMGRLNASHLTFHREPWPEEATALPKEPPTAHPGWIFDDSVTPGPLKILRAIPGSPAAMFPGCPPDGPIGWTVRRIAGVPVDNRYPLENMFREAENRAFPVVLEDPAGKPHTIELRCISYREARKLTQLADDAARAETVATRFPGGRYFRLSQMDRESVDALEIQLHRSMADARGIILDLRGNEGGREADRLLSWFHQPNHAVTQPRGGPVGYPADRLSHPVWHGPLVVLCDEHTFSNAEIFCHALLASGRAKLVGRPTAGGVISAVLVKLPGIGSVQIPYRGWFRAGDRQNLDLHGAQPDLEVLLTPSDEHNRLDPQLDAAIRLLNHPETGTGQTPR